MVEKMKKKVHKKKLKISKIRTRKNVLGKFFCTKIEKIKMN